MKSILLLSPPQMASVINVSDLQLYPIKALPNRQVFSYKMSFLFLPEGSCGWVSRTTIVVTGRYENTQRDKLRHFSYSNHFKCKKKRNYAAVRLKKITGASSVV